MLAAERGMIATFMPKPFADRTGSGLHLHLSLTSGGAPGLPRRRRRRAASACPPTAYAFVGGILEHACALQAVLAPDGQLLQAHRRRRPRASGASWSPAVADLRRQRPHPLRPGPRRPPRRAARRRRLGQPLPRDRRGARRRARRHRAQPRPGRRRARRRRPRTLPPTLLHAVDALEADPVVTGALDAAGRRGGRRTSPTSSARSSSPGTARSAPGSSTSYLTAF